MASTDRAVNALTSLFPKGKIHVEKSGLYFKRDGSIGTEPHYRYAVKLPNGGRAFDMNYYGEDFIKQFSDAELVEVFRERFAV